jgi:hypothetical protein
MHQRKIMRHEWVVSARAQAREAIQEPSIATTAARSRDDDIMEHELPIPHQVPAVPHAAVRNVGGKGSGIGARREGRAQPCLRLRSEIVRGQEHRSAPCASNATRSI